MAQPRIWDHRLFDGTREFVAMKPFGGPTKNGYTKGDRFDKSKSNGRHMQTLWRNGYIVYADELPKGVAITEKKKRGRPKKVASQEISTGDKSNGEN